ncbi:hypothetical protein HDU86_008469 [Geranomyces michiganensis]|nr:hypothetical protein HDU86_008469 [Geranomyces michiganensis]
MSSAQESLKDETLGQDAGGHVFQVINTDDGSSSSSSSASANSNSNSDTTTASASDSTSSTSNLFSPATVLHAASTAYASASHLAGVAVENLRHAAHELSEAASELKETVLGSEDVDDDDDIGVVG